MQALGLIESIDVAADLVRIHERRHAEPSAVATNQALLPLLEAVHEALAQGTAVAIHCHAGIGRTGVVSGCLLHRLGVPCDDIFHVLSRARGYAMPETAAQRAWAEAFMRDRP